MGDPEIAFEKGYHAGFQDGIKFGASLSLQLIKEIKEERVI